MFRMYRWGAAMLLLLTCALFTAPVSAEDESDVTVIVTAERTSQPISESISSATVVTAKEIKEKGAQTVADALRTVPGLTIVQNGELGALSSARIRGTASAQTLVLIDGERLTSSAFGGTADLAKIPVDNVMRIEVIRGPVSSLYGSDAIGGVINIITKRPTVDSGEYTFGYGTHNRAERSLVLRGVSDSVLWQINGSVPQYSGSRPNSDFTATDLSGRLIFPDAMGWDVTVNGNIYHDKLGLPGSISFSSLNDTQWWNRKNVNLSAKRTIAGGQLEIHGYLMNQQLKELNPDWFTDTLITGIARVGEMTYSRNFGDQQLVFGTEYRDESYRDIENGTVAQDKHVTNSALFIQDRMPIGEKLDLVAGLRLDDHSTAGNRVTPRLGITREFGANTRVRASYSEGFRAPSLVELYYNNFGSKGNPNLKPEKSAQYELGINTKCGKNTFDIALFTSRLRDQIAFVLTDPVFFTGTFENLERTRQKGIEFTWTRPIGNTADLSLAYTYIDAVNLSKDTRLNGIPFNQAGLTLSKELGCVNISLTGRWVDDRVFGSLRTASYTLFDLYLAKTGNTSINPYVVVRNLGDKKYDEVAGYPAEGRSFEFGVRSSW
ncbi:MAG: TonB-dependent receptor plug domain-containing protein [Armatimonadota bacterium]